jgi:hypothetical protein
VTPPPRPRGAREARAALELALGKAGRASPAVAAWRWRYELLAAAGLAAIWATLPVADAAAVTGALAAALAGTACLPAGRAFLTARAWCIVTPHRLRAGCTQGWIHSRSGKIPAVLLTRCRPFGERVYLWCRAGTSAEDLSAARGLLAAACWADDIRVSRHPRHAHIVAVDVIRRESALESADGGGTGAGVFLDAARADAGPAPYYVPGPVSTQTTFPVHPFGG